MAAQLAEQECKPCKGDVPPLEGDALQEKYRELDSDWSLIEEKKLEKEFSFDDYPSAVQFTDKVAAIAQAQDHHPDLLLTYGKVKVTVWTHKIGGLSDSDFVFAAKAEKAYQEM